MIQKERYLLNIACIDVSGQNFGTILSLYAFGSVDDMQESIRKDHVQQGDAATRKFSKFISHAPCAGECRDVRAVRTGAADLR
jgi:hypothetical protein